tara:strand:- start:2741 stop:3016 length:276 start_codon:yes stop_codon:yes gene_type:complete
MGCSHEYIKRSDVGYFLFLSCDLHNYMGGAMNKRFQYEFTHHTVGLAKIHIKDGMYSLPELEQMLSDFKKAAAHMNTQLAQTMKEVKQVIK